MLTRDHATGSFSESFYDKIAATFRQAPATPILLTKNMHMSNLQITLIAGQGIYGRLARCDGIQATEERAVVRIVVQGMENDPNPKNRRRGATPPGFYGERSSHLRRVERRKMSTRPPSDLAGAQRLLAAFGGRGDTGRDFFSHGAPCAGEFPARATREFRRDTSLRSTFCYLFGVLFNTHTTHTRHLVFSATQHIFAPRDGAKE